VILERKTLTPNVPVSPAGQRQIQPEWSIHHNFVVPSLQLHHYAKSHRLINCLVLLVHAYIETLTAKHVALS